MESLGVIFTFLSGKGLRLFHLILGSPGATGGPACYQMVGESGSLSLYHSQLNCVYSGQAMFWATLLSLTVDPFFLEARGIQGGPGGPGESQGPQGTLGIPSLAFPWAPWPSLAWLKT